MTALRAVIYARQSVRQDEGIDRQIARCGDLIRAREWMLAGEYRDNDVSATKARGSSTGWGRMLADQAAGKFDVIVAVNVDRLLRRLSDLAVLTERGMRVVTVEGDLDLSTDAGGLLGGLLTLFADFEVKRKESRMSVVREQRRVDGHPSPGRTPFGYCWVTKAVRDQRNREGHPDPDRRWDVDPVAAGHIRWAAQQALSGERTNIAEITAGLKDRGARTRPTVGHPDGGPIGPSTVRRMLLSPFLAGRLPVSQGPAPGSYLVERVSPEETIEGAWEAIFSMEQWLALRSRLLDAGRRTNSAGTARRWPLGGLAVCGVCGGRMRSAVDRLKHRAYRCPNGHILRRAIPVDTIVISNALDRLRQVDIAGLLLQPSMEGQASLADLHVKKESLEARIRGLVRMVARSGVGAQEIELQLEELELEYEMTMAALALASRTDPLAPFRDTARPEDVWSSLTLSRQREVLEALFERIEVLPLGPGRRLALMEEKDVVATMRLSWRGDATTRPAGVGGSRLDAGEVPVALLSQEERDRLAKALSSGPASVE